MQFAMFDVGWAAIPIAAAAMAMVIGMSRRLVLAEKRLASLEAELAVLKGGS